MRKVAIYDQTVCTVLNCTIQTDTCFKTTSGGGRLAYTCYYAQFKVEYPPLLNSTQNVSSIKEKRVAKQKVAEGDCLKLNISSNYTCYYNRHQIAEVQWDAPDAKDSKIWMIVGWTIFIIELFLCIGICIILPIGAACKIKIRTVKRPELDLCAASPPPVMHNLDFRRRHRNSAAFVSLIILIENKTKNLAKLTMDLGL
ncbi:unnamed protein product, partial [Didymodactylos carnosus]